MENIRKLFYTYRNGVVVDALKSAGDPHRMIFGLQLPQLSQIAREVLEETTPEERTALAQKLWGTEADCRESRLLACYLFDPFSMRMEEAEKLLDDCRTREETDILVFRCLRNHPDAAVIKEKRTGTYDAEALGRFV